MAEIRSGAIYKVEFHVIEDNRRDPHDELSKTDELKKDETELEKIAKKEEKEKKAMLSSGKKAAFTAIAASTFIYNYAMNDTLNSFALQGDSIAARNLQYQKQVTNELIGIGVTLLGGTMVGGLPGLALTSTAIATKYAIQAINHQQEVNAYENKQTLDKYMSEQNRARIQRNSREFR